MSIYVEGLLMAKCEQSRSSPNLPPKKCAQGPP